MRRLILLFIALLLGTQSYARAQTPQNVVDIPTRPGITQRLLVLSPPDPKAAVMLYPGGHGGLQLFANGSIKWGEDNFMVRTRQIFADQGLMVVVVDAPSDRQTPPFFKVSARHPGTPPMPAPSLRGYATLQSFPSGS
jgi:hypothetical protein